MRSQSSTPLPDYSAILDGKSELPSEPTCTEVPSGCANTDFLQGYISEQDYALRRGVTLRTCQRDRQLQRAPPHIHLGRRIFYRIDALRGWLLSNELLQEQRPARSRSRRL
jgi:hypothetical protein